MEKENESLCYAPETNSTLWGGSVVKNPSIKGDAGDRDSIPGSVSSPGVENGNSLQHFYQDNSMDRGAWQATVCGVAKSQTWLIDWAHASVKKNHKLITLYNHISSVQFSRSVMPDSLWPHEPQHARPPCPSLTPRVHPNPCPLNWWCHPAISSSVVPFSSCPQSLPASGSFPMSQLFASGGQSIGVSASTSVLPMNTQDWSPLGWTG